MKFIRTYAAGSRVESCFRFFVISVCSFHSVILRYFLILLGLRGRILSIYKSGAKMPADNLGALLVQQLELSLQSDTISHRNY